MKSARAISSYSAHGSSQSSQSQSTSSRHGRSQKNSQSATLKTLLKTKTIGNFAGICLLVNAMTGPSIPYTSDMFQNGGVLPPVLLFIIFTVISTLSCLFIVEAMQAIPGNKHFQGVVEFGTLVNFYFGKKAHILAQICLFGAIQANAVQSIVLSSQAFDNILLDLFQVTCGVAFNQTAPWQCVRENVKMSASPFVDSNGVSPWMLVTLGFVLVMVFIIPMGMLNFDANVSIQLVTFCLSFAIFTEWIISCAIFYHSPKKNPLNTPEPLQFVGGNIEKLSGTVMLSVAFTYVVPSWINAKDKNVNAQASLWTSALITMCLYLAIGIFPAMLLPKIEGGNVLPMLKQFGIPQGLNMVTVYLFSIVMLLPSIPVSCIVARNNLIQNKVCGKDVSMFLSFMLPWIVAIPFLTNSDSLQSFQNWTSLVFVSTSNFLVPIIIYLKCHAFRTAYNRDRGILTKKQRELLKAIHYHSREIAKWVDYPQTKDKSSRFKDRSKRSRPRAIQSNQSEDTSHQKLGSNFIESGVSPRTPSDSFAYGPKREEKQNTSARSFDPVASSTFQTSISQSDIKKVSSSPQAVEKSAANPVDSSSFPNQTVQSVDAFGMKKALSHDSEISVDRPLVTLEDMARASRASKTASLHPPSHTEYQRILAGASPTGSIPHGIPPMNILPRPKSENALSPPSRSPSHRSLTQLYSQTKKNSPESKHSLNETGIQHYKSENVSISSIPDTGMSQDSMYTSRIEESQLPVNPVAVKENSCMSLNSAKLETKSLLSATGDSIVPSIQIINAAVDEKPSPLEFPSVQRARALSVDAGKAIAQQRALLEERRQNLQVLQNVQPVMPTSGRSSLPAEMKPNIVTLAATILENEKTDAVLPAAISIVGTNLGTTASAQSSANSESVLNSSVVGSLRPSQNLRPRTRSASVDAGMFAVAKLNQLALPPTTLEVAETSSNSSMEAVNIVKKPDSRLDSGLSRKADGFRVSHLRKLRGRNIKNPNHLAPRSALQELKPKASLDTKNKIVTSFANADDDIEADLNYTDGRAQTLDDEGDFKLRTMPFEDMSENEKYLLEDVPDPSQEDREYQKRKEELYKLPLYVGGTAPGMVSIGQTKEKPRGKHRFPKKSKRPGYTASDQETSTQSDQDRSLSLNINASLRADSSVDGISTLSPLSPLQALGAVFKFPSPLKSKSAASDSTKSSDGQSQVKSQSGGDVSKLGNPVKKTASRTSIVSFGKLELINPNFYRTMSLPIHPGFVATTFRSLPRFITKRIPARYVAYFCLLVTTTITFVNLILLIKCQIQNTCSD